MRIIALSAKMGAGKTTVADMLCEMIPGSVRVGFGDNIKQEAAATYGFPLDLCYSEAGKQSVVFIGEEGLKNLGAHTLQVRQVLQRHGTDFRRKQDPAYWDNKMREALYVAEVSGCPAVVVDDLRFTDEAKLIRDAGGYLFRINTYDGWVGGKFSDHISETDLDSYQDFDCSFYPEFGKLDSIASAIIEYVNSGGDHG